LARKILLADDSVTAQNMGRKILADAGYEVITVNNGSAALKKIGETRPDLIVLDVYMPGYSGLEVCQRVKEVGDTSRIPILLTVGKLEPFKPEEAKRVRADAFIVKPFEASELLSALSKLEDKVVPRADSSKPGRFARATAAIEEGRYDKVMAVEDDNSGWKNRISFPKKKKEKPPGEEISTREIYNPVNKDLRTTIDHKKEEHAPTLHAAPAEEHHVNVGALAPEGLPKDVTPEEIAALAAAAAQIQGKAVEEAIPAPVTEAPLAAAAPVAEAKSESAAGTKTENVEPDKVLMAHPAEVASAPEAANATPATLAEPEKTEEKKPEHKSGPAEVMAAIAGLETEWISLPAAGLGNGSWNRAEKESPEPVTMAVAVDSSAPAPRWTAVAVAVAPEEAAVSLEQEMQKAYAAFAAAEGRHAPAASGAPETTTAAAEPVSAPAAVAESAVSERAAMQAEASIPAMSAPEVAQPLAAVSEGATEAVSAAVRKLEAVAAKYEAEQSAASPDLGTDKSVKAEALESPVPAVSDASAVPDQTIEETAEEKDEQSGETKVEEQPPLVPHEPSPQEIASALTTVFAVPQIEPQNAATQVAEPQEEPAPASLTEAVEPAAKAVVSEEKSSSEESTDTVPVPCASITRGMDEMAKRESETAAAWASWRKIRETGSSKPGQTAETSVKEPEESIPHDRAAMAVAAGAESKPEEATNSLDSDPEIAGIVDSVLADMRPKIVEEIARKLGKKK
jgi:twitching motility two-component system response regulator PilH